METLGCGLNMVNERSLNRIIWEEMKDQEKGG